MRDIESQSREVGEAGFSFGAVVEPNGSWGQTQVLPGQNAEPGARHNEGVLKMVKAESLRPVPLFGREDQA
jgi:hypothetical protein